MGYAGKSFVKYHVNLFMKKYDHWSGKRCSKPPEVTNAVVDFADPDTYPWGTGDTVNFICTPSSTPGPIKVTGPTLMTCMDIGEWSYSFVC